MAKKKEETKEEQATQQTSTAVLKGDKCISCKVSIVNDTAATRFPCPNCGKHIIIRCSKCRKIVAKYKCPECGFEGPN